MTDWQKKAEEKLKKESKGIKGRYEAVVSTAVCEALLSFVAQSDEFARAVCQTSGSFADCLKKVVEGVQTSLSDIEAYRRAVAFYFPGAQVDMALTIRMNEYEREEKSDVTLSLFDLM